jgi:hypothetical protein
MQTEMMVQTEDRRDRATADSNVFSPVAMLPVQFNCLIRGSFVPDGERRLMVAVLDAAVHDYLQNAHYTTSGQRMRFAEVNQWMNQPGACSALFSFQWLCDALGIDANRLRKTLGALRRRGMSSRLSSIGAASGHYRSVRKITVGATASRNIGSRRRRSL